ncbi:hypothetical protein [Streptomyces sp900105755]|uniref:Uncharacterized protein n=1 Tax=Streptomyces sp. 900105755 TaxID=3154389 RepID=A0ABV1TMH5_9ACTN
MSGGARRQAGALAEPVREPVGAGVEDPDGYRLVLCQRGWCNA